MTNISAAAQTELDAIAELFQVSDSSLLEISKSFDDAFRRGLQVADQPIVMGPSWVTRKADGTEKGTVLVLDISWNCIFVSKINLDGKRLYTSDMKDFPISKDMMKADGGPFFDFLANSVKVFLKENSVQENNLPLGVIFPFSVQKTSLVNGKLLSWSKGFAIKNAVGQDPSQLLQNALDKAGVGIKVTALVNDTVAALLSESYLSAPCIMSVIYGAGTNGAYAQDSVGITKLPQLKSEQMLINTEWAAFENLALLKPNIFDDKVDQASVNPGSFRFQKMTCWFYHGETVRVVLLSLVKKSLLFNGVATETLEKYHGLSSFHSFQMEDAKDLAIVKNIISEMLGYDEDAITDQDAQIVRQVSTIISSRGARIAACPIAALLAHLGHASLGKNNVGTGGKLPIATHGELFVGSVQFSSRLNKSLGSILGEDFVKRLVFHMVKDSGVVGAAIAANK